MSRGSHNIQSLLYCILVTCPEVVTISDNQCISLQGFHKITQNMSGISVTFREWTI